MKSSITAGLSEGDKQEMTAEFKNCYRLRKRLTAMLDNDKEVILSQMLEADATTANWAIDQSIMVAELKAIKKMQALLN